MALAPMGPMAWAPMGTIPQGPARAQGRGRAWGPADGAVRMGRRPRQAPGGSEGGPLLLLHTSRRTR